MGLTIHWELAGPKSKAQATSIVEKMRQRAMDLPFESVGVIVHFQGEAAQFDNNSQDDPYRWLKIMARQIVWNTAQTVGWDCRAKEIVGFQIDVAPGSEPMEIYLASYPKTIQVESKRIRTNLSTWSGTGFTKTQYASNARCGGIPNFLRAHLSVCRLLDHAKELGILKSVSDEGDFFENRDIPALVNTIADWNAFIAAGVGAMDELVGCKVAAPIRSFPDFEHLEANGQNQIDRFLQTLKGVPK